MRGTSRAGLARRAGAGARRRTAWLLYLGVFPTSIGFTTWTLALGRMRAGRAGTISYLISPTAIGISWLLLGETPGWMAVGGGVLSIAGVMLARSSGRPTVGRRRRVHVDAATRGSSAIE